jgi:glyoxylate/hydroxypyruvate reductase A
MTSEPVMLLAFGADGTGGAIWAEALQDALPSIKVQPLERPVDPDRVRYVAAWRHPPGTLRAFPNLRAIFSLGAGVDHLLADPDLPAEVPIVRVVDPDLTHRMSEWVLLNVLMVHRQVRLYEWQQSQKMWEEDVFQPAAKDVRVGVMGMGVLGEDAARKLAAVGFDVAGWSRSSKQVAGIETYAGPEELDAFLDRTQILVSLLPLTPETRGILNSALFAKLARDSHFGGPILLNAGRGALQNEADIVAALDQGTLKAAILDVFEQEPLPAASPLWDHPAVTVTPHNAAISHPAAISAYIASEVARLEAGEPPHNVVNLDRAY